MSRKIRPFDDSLEKDRRRSTADASSDTSAYDSYRQGVELTSAVHYANGIMKIHNGYNDQTGNHEVPQLVLGQGRPRLRDENSFLEGVKFDPITRFEDNIDTSWSPLDDLGTLSILLMPGGYNPDGINTGMGRWLDVSGNGWNADSPGGGSNPTSDGGCPVFDGVNDYLTIAASLADNVIYPAATLSNVNNGTVIVIASQIAMGADTSDYFNAGLITGTGATPGLYMTDTNVKCVGFDGSGYIRANAPSGAPSVSDFHICFGAWDSNGLYAAADENAFSSVTAYGGGPLSSGNIGAETKLGQAYSTFNACTIRCVAVYPYKVDDAKIAQWHAWATSHGLSL